MLTGYGFGADRTNLSFSSSIPDGIAAPPYHDGPGEGVSSDGESRHVGAKTHRYRLE